MTHTRGPGCIKCKLVHEHRYRYVYRIMMIYSNKNVTQCMVEFEHAMENGAEIMRSNSELNVDAGVVTEAFTMGYTSKKCDHLTKKDTTNVSYERPPKSLIDITTHLTSMSMNMTTNTFKDGRTRHNPVTSAIVCGIQSMIDFAGYISSNRPGGSTIIFTDVLSVLHAATMAFVFRSLYLHYCWDARVKMILLVRSETMSAMGAFVGSTENVQLVPCNDVFMQLYTIVNTSSTPLTMVNTHSKKIADMCLTAFGDAQPIVNLVTSVKSLVHEHEIAIIVESMNAVVEAVVCSNPVDNLIRITPAITSTDMSSRKVASPSTNVSYIAMMRWYSNMIRHMNMNEMCFDCLIALRVARSIAGAMTNRHMHEFGDVVKDPVRNFRAHVGTVGTTDEFEI